MLPSDENSISFQFEQFLRSEQHPVSDLVLVPDLVSDLAPDLLPDMIPDLGLVPKRISRAPKTNIVFDIRFGR